VRSSCWGNTLVEEVFQDDYRMAVRRISHFGQAAQSLPASGAFHHSNRRQVAAVSDSRRSSPHLLLRGLMSSRYHEEAACRCPFIGREILSHHQTSYVKVFTFTRPSRNGEFLSDERVALNYLI
jgi:hypothetical protein